MIGKHHACGQKADAVGRPLKQRKESERVLEKRLNLGAHQWHQDENTKQTVNDARYRRQQVDHERQDVRNPPGRQFGKKNRCAQTKRDRDQHTQAEVTRVP